MKSNIVDYIDSSFSFPLPENILKYTVKSNKTLCSCQDPYSIMYNLYDNEYLLFLKIVDYWYLLKGQIKGIS